MNLPNSITAIRLILSPFVMFFLLAPVGGLRTLAPVLFVIAAVSDLVDGWLARRWGQVTPWGQLLDPLADKVMVLAALFGLVALQWVPAWAVAVIVARDVAVSGLRAATVLKGHVIPASHGGKIKTLTQVVSLSALMFLETTWPYLPTWPWMSLFYLAVVLTVITGFDYFLAARRLAE